MGADREDAYVQISEEIVLEALGFGHAGDRRRQPRVN